MKKTNPDVSIDDFSNVKNNAFNFIHYLLYSDPDDVMVFEIKNDNISFILNRTDFFFSGKVVDKSSDAVKYIEQMIKNTEKIIMERWF